MNLIKHVCPFHMSALFGFSMFRVFSRLSLLTSNGDLKFHMRKAIRDTFDGDIN